jgi:hypothetical protein
MEDKVGCGVVCMRLQTCIMNKINTFGSIRDLIEVGINCDISYLLLPQKGKLVSF